MALQLRPYDTTSLYLIDNTILLSADSIFCALVDATHVYDAANSVLADVVANEISGNGYSRFQITPAFSRIDAPAFFDSDVPTFNAVGGSITASHAIFFSLKTVGPIVNPLIFEVDLDGPITAADGFPLTVTPNPSGWFQQLFLAA